MERMLAATTNKTRSPRCQLPITGSAHKATVKSDGGVAAGRVLTARDVATERSGAAALDSTHHLHLGQAHMPGIGFTPSRTVITEDVRDLQSWTGHARRWLGRDLALLALRLVRHIQSIERALDGRDQAGGNPRVARRRLQLLVAQQSRPIMHLLLTH